MSGDILLTFNPGSSTIKLGCLRSMPTGRAASAAG
jgi:hypothetical protein